MQGMKAIGIYLFPGVEELDAIGPWEVLAFWTREFRQDGWQTLLVADTLQPVTAAKGAVLTPHTTVSDDLDLVVVPAQPPPTTPASTNSWPSTPPSRPARRTAGSTTATSSPAPASPRGSTWPSTWSADSSMPIAPGRYAAESSTTRSHRCEPAPVDRRVVPLAHRRVERALDAHARSPRRVDQARTELAFGEFLRRSRRRGDAREHLRAALDTFEDVGAAPWATRARYELRASGETSRKRDSSTPVDLTPKERLHT
jgi:hypothetical protein